MKSAIRDRLFQWVLVPGLAVVLAVLAVLQFQWSREVSEANRAQMQASLQTSLLGFRQDLSRELSDICLEVRSAMEGESAGSPVKIGVQLQHWQQTSTHPDLVSYVYLWNSDQPDKLLRFVPGTPQPDSSAWPADMQRLHDRIQEISSQFQGLPQRPRRWRPTHPHSPGADRLHRRPGGERLSFPWGVDQSIPALVYPWRSRSSNEEQSSSGRLTWTIVALNTNALSKEIFPELAQKYFSHSAGAEYNVAVRQTGENDRRIIYATSPKFGSDGQTNVDASLNLFGPPFRRNGPSPGFEFFVVPQPPSQSDHSVQSSSGPVVDRLVRFEPFHYSPEQSPWEIAVKHQSGSVDAAVTALRRKNLMLGFGVLLVLAVTMALVVVGAQRARRLARMQMDFVAGVSHEVRTPLAAISSAAENLAHGVVRDPQQLVRYGNSILKQTKQLSHLVEQVLQFAATQQAPRQRAVAPVSVTEAIDTALEGTAGVVATSNAKVDLEIPPDLPAVSADLGALVQCLQNLITNAVKYGGADHWLSVRASFNKPLTAPGNVEITVEDHGIGISSEELKHIFDPFYRSPSVVDSQVHGTGLGLTLTRGLIESMGGRLSAKSELGKGSAFTLHLPVAASLAQEDHALETDRPGGAAPDFSS